MSMMVNWLWTVTPCVFKGCRPYSFAECEHYTNGSRPACNVSATPTPKCVEQCDEGYTLAYQDDKQFGKFHVVSLQLPNSLPRRFYGHFPCKRALAMVALVTNNIVIQRTVLVSCPQNWLLAFHSNVPREIAKRMSDWSSAAWLKKK